MPLSRRRKKKGKPVGNGMAGRKERLERVGEMESGVSLQDLINVLAYQEYVKDGTIVAEDAEIHIPEDGVPVTVGEGDDKREVGTATPIPGDEEHLSINITDPDILKQIQCPVENFSIYEEN